MRQQPVNIIGGAYTDDALPWSCQDTVNLLPVAAEAAGTRTPTKLSTAPGLRPWVKIGDGADYAIRGMRDVEGKLFVVSGAMLYQISNTGIAIPRGTIPGVGRVSMAHNQITGGNELLVVNGDSGFVWNTVDETFTKITDEGYPGAFVADFIDGYLAQVEPFGRFWFHSDLASALDYNTIDRYEAESSPDRIVALLSDHLEVWVFGERTAEIFANTGAGTGTFQSKRISIEKGCAGRYTPAKLDNGVAWLGSDGVVYQAQGYNPVRISTRAIESAIADLDWSKAFAFTWADRGHEVYYLTFPDGQTFGYDASQRQWHRRASWHPVYDIGRRWRVNAIARHNGQWIAGDYRSGELYVLDWDYPREGDSDPLVRERVGGVMHGHQNRVSIPFAEVIVEAGGEPVAAVEFPAQPQGPTIEGAAPDGAVTFPYAGYAYTITAGDSPIESITVVSGTLPPGLTLDGDGEIDTGPPTEGGSFTFTIRVTDETGLWAELTDTVVIADVGFFLRDQGEGLWVGHDLVNWEYYSFTPTTVTSQQGDVVVSGSRFVVSGTLSSLNREYYVRGPIPPYTGSTISVTSSIEETSLTLLPSFLTVSGDVVIGWERNSNYPRYKLSSNNGTNFANVTLGTNRRCYGLRRMESGRWVACFTNNSTGASDMFYSDEAIPGAWADWTFAQTLSIGVPFGSSVGAGDYGYVVNNGRNIIMRSSDGAAWAVANDGSHTFPLTPRIHVTATGRVIVFGDSDYISISDDHASAFVDVSVPVGIEEIRELDGVLYASALTGTNFYTSSDDGDSWAPHAIPDDPGAGPYIVPFRIQA